MRASRTFILPLVAIASLIATVPTAAAATRKVPFGFAGVTMDPWEMKRDGLDIQTEVNRAAAAGVESIRFPIYWFDVKPYQNGNYDWRAVDEFVAAAARARVALLPDLLGAPKWAADSRYGGPGSVVTLTIPRDPEEFAAFARDTVTRYRQGGQFWNDNPTLVRPEFRYWQVWNEPDFTRFWPQHLGERQTVTVAGKRTTSSDFRFAPTYLALLRPTSAAIRAADPTAKIMLGSMTNLAWDSFARLYKAGGKGLGKTAKLFDAVGINIFTSKPSSLVTAFAKTRSALSAYGDSSLKLALTEYSWTSAKGIEFADMKLRYIIGSQSDQATNLKAAFGLLVTNRLKYNLDSGYWYSWATPDSGSSSVWDYSGLRGYPNGTAQDKPALLSYSTAALAAEGCAAKVVADSCLR